MRWLLIGAAFLVWASAAHAQSCRAGLIPQEMRQSSVAELIGDITLDCSGGSGRLDVLVLSDAPFGNRDLSPEIDPAWGLTDALMLVGDPVPAAQKPCVLAASNATCPAGAGFNVFQGRRLQDNLVAFQAIPYADGARLRIVNLRASALTAAPGLQLLVYSGGRAVAVENAKITLPAVQGEPAVVIQTPNGQPVGPSGLVLARSQLPLGDPVPLRSVQVKIAESTPNGFRRRNLGSNAGDPTFIVSQASPGASYGTETGFYNAAFPEQYGLNIAGLAESGTRIRVDLRDIPRGVRVWAALRDTGPTAARALLTYTNPDGSGVFSRVSDLYPGYSELYVENGAANAVWEIVSADPTRLETLVFSLAVSALDGSPGLGTITARVALGPGGPPGAYPIFSSAAVPLPAIRIANVAETPPLSVVSAATLAGPAVSPDSIATLLGSGLADAPAAANGAPVAALGNITVKLTDSTGAESSALLYYVSPGQVNFLVQPNLAPGQTLVRVFNGDVLAASGTVAIEPLAPGLFSADGNPGGPASGLSLRIGETASAPAALATAAGGQWSPSPISLDESAGPVYVSIYATGLRRRSSLENVTATIGGISVPVLFAGASTAAPGLDQVNLGPLPAAVFRGKGPLPVQLTIDGKSTNSVIVAFGQ